MPALTTKEELESLIQKLMRKEGIDHYVIKTEGESAKGENYLGEVIFLSVVPKNVCAKTYNLVIKTAKKSPELRKIIPIESAYKRESYMYSKVYQEYADFLRSLNSGIKFDYIPKVYWVCNDKEHETIIMENLRNDGYDTIDRTKPMNLEHVLFVMENIGKHHAISLAFKDQKPEAYHNFTKNLNDVWREFAKTMVVEEFQKPLIEHIMNLLREEGREDLVEKYKVIQENLEEIVKGDRVPEEKSVICHGDFWMNNMMFKYQGGNTSKPSSICFVDFQLSTLDTPVRDLAFFLYSACDKTVLDKFELVLQTYHESLSKTLKQLGSSEDLFTYQELMDHWKKYGDYGLVSSAQIIRMALMATEEAPDLSTIAEEGIELSKAFDSKMKLQDEYDRRVVDVFTHFAEKFL